MAFNKAPNAWFPSWAVSSTDVVVPIASFPELTDVEAHGSTGDIRKVIFALLEKLWAAWVAAGSDSQPNQMTVSKSSSTNVDTGIITNTYTIRIYTAVSAQEVNAET